MKKIMQWFLVMLFFTLVSGCASTRIIRYETIIRQSKPPDFPMEIVDPANTNRPYKVIGVVQRKLSNTEDTIENLKDGARKMGGDALLDFQQVFSKSGVLMPIGDMYVYKNAKEIWSAKVIVWEKP